MSSMMKTMIIERICMNESCKDNEYLVDCPTDRPIIKSGKVCWYCKSSKDLVEQK